MTGNAYIDQMISILKWLVNIIVLVAALGISSLRIVGEFAKFNGGDDSEQSDAKKKIRDVLVWDGIILFILYVANYIFNQMLNVHNTEMPGLNIKTSSILIFNNIVTTLVYVQALLSVKFLI